MVAMARNRTEKAGVIKKKKKSDFRKNNILLFWKGKGV